MKIELFTVGNIKEPYLRDGIAEYQKRLRPYADLAIYELPEGKLPLNPGKTEIIQALNQEGNAISKRLNPRASQVALCIEGRAYSSEEFSGKIEDWMVQGGGVIQFLIGSSYGLSEEIKRGKEKLSFSLMTFPHQLMRLVLLEQIYRGFRILRNEPYHK